MVERFITPGPLPTTSQAELLVILAEECGEVAVRVSKALRFGLDEVQPGQDATNAERIGQELQDVAALVSVCVEAGVLSVDLEEPAARRRKLLRVSRFCQHEENIAPALRLLGILPPVGESETPTDHANLTPLPDAEAEALGYPNPGAESGRERIYVASKTYQAPAWRALRDKAGWPIISTWIDEAGPGETKCHIDLWRRCIDEAKSATGLILYAEDGDLLKGALLETGAALACGVPVAVVGPAEAMKTAKNHPGVIVCDSLDKARDALSKREGDKP